MIIGLKYYFFLLVLPLFEGVSEERLLLLSLFDEDVADVDDHDQEYDDAEGEEHAAEGALEVFGRLALIRLLIRVSGLFMIMFKHAPLRLFRARIC